MAVIYQKLNSTFRLDTNVGVTFVNRENGDLQKKIQQRLDMGGVITVLSGATKIEKTVLVEKLLKDSGSNYVSVQGDDLNNNSLEEILKNKLSYQEYERVRTKESKSAVNYSAEAKAEAKSGFWVGFLKVVASIKLKTSIKGEDAEDEKYAVHQKGTDVFRQLIERMISEDTVLLIDDFHYLDADKQRAVLRKLKEPVGKGLKVLILLIPSRTDLIKHQEPDLAGRLYVIDMPAWTPAELQMIPAKGFKELGISVTEEMLTYIADFSFGSPALSQNISLLVAQSMFEGDSVSAAQLDWGKILEDIVSVESSLLHALRDGAKTRGTERQKYKTKKGDNLDLYQLVLLVLGDNLALKGLDSSLLRKKIILLLDDKNVKPKRQQVENTLSAMASIAEENSYYDPVIVYDGIPATIKLSDAMFKLTLKLYRLKWEEENGK